MKIMQLLSVTITLASGNMASAPRVKNKATKIAFAILGTPDNYKFKRSKEQERVNRQLLFQETSRVR